MTDSKTLYFSDIYMPPDPADAHADLSTSLDMTIRDGWEERKEGRLYLAVRQILTLQFRFNKASGDEATKLPASHEDFYGVVNEDITDVTVAGLDLQATAAFVAIYGQLVGPYSDPLMGRDRKAKGRGDLLIKDPQPDGTPLNPDFGETDDGSGPGMGKYDFHVPARFVNAVVDAIKELTTYRKLYTAVYDTIVSEALLRLKTTAGIDDTADDSAVKASQIAEVGKRLAEQQVRHDDPQLRRKIISAFSATLGGEVDGRASMIDINLPDMDLDMSTSSDIVPENVLALSAAYFCGMLEEMRYFTVADRLVEQFMNGMLPISRGEGGQRIYSYIKKATDRFTEAERRGLYARGFGLAQGSVEVETPNREFSDLWIRFLSAVSLLNRETQYVQKSEVHAQQVHKNAHDLAVNLSLHGYAISHFFAVELQELVTDVNEMLSHPDMLNAFGVRDQWQLVDRVSSMYLGGPVNTLRYRTQAQSGARIMKWLSQNSAVLASPFATLKKDLFSKRELVDEVERWLAVTGTTDSTVQEYSEPVLTAVQSSLPPLSLASFPEAIQSTLDQVGTINTGALPAV